VRGRKGKPECERGSTNVYADLGFRAPADMLVKAKLVSKIAELIAERGLIAEQGRECARHPSAEALQGAERAVSRFLGAQAYGLPDTARTGRGHRRSRHIPCEREGYGVGVVRLISMSAKSRSVRRTGREYVAARRR
jgi:hypothetical protein